MVKNPDNSDGKPGWQFGSYINLIFTDTPLNDQPENALLLASQLVEAVHGSEKWGSSIEIEVERFRFIAGTINPWGLLIRIIGFGRTEEQARRAWGKTSGCLDRAMGKLSKEFRWNGLTK